MKFKCQILSVLGLLITLFGCSQGSNDFKKMSFQFYQLNKRNLFEGLYDVYIGDRAKYVFDAPKNKYDVIIKYIYVYDLDINRYLSIPVFSKNTSIFEKKETFKKCDSLSKKYLVKRFGTHLEDELFEHYDNYITTILKKYYSIKTPESYNNKSVIIKGNPSIGNFITFILHANCKCYYVKDKKSLTPYWSNYFNDSRKINEHWYYDVMNFQ